MGGVVNRGLVGGSHDYVLVEHIYIGAEEQ